jgi:hypothetical protein
MLEVDQAIPWSFSKCRDEELVPHLNIQIYASYAEMKKCIFLDATKDNAPLPPKMVNSVVNVLTDFVTIIKYRKRGINKILSEYVEMIRAVPLDYIRQKHKIHSWGLGSWDADTKTNVMDYDKELKDFTTMFGKEPIL